MVEPICTHGSHPHAYLFEGNDYPALVFDEVFGSSSHNTAFRNRFRAWDDYSTAGLTAFYIAGGQQEISAVGNVLGQSGTAPYDCLVSGGACGIYTMLQVLGLNGIPGSLIRGGNYDTFTNSVVWNNNAPDGPSNYLSPRPSLPVSFYKGARAQKPQWWNTAPWPPIGFDVPGGDSNVGPHAYVIPARACFENTIAKGIAFSAAACYGP
jgi:hypothetical protein